MPADQAASGNARPMSGRDLTEHVRAMSDEQLEAARRDIVTGLGFMTPANGMHGPARAFLGAVTGELARRGSRASGAAPGTAGIPASRPGLPGASPPRNGDTLMPELDIEEVRASLEATRQLRLALDLLERNLPPAYGCDGLSQELWALREKLAAAELTQLRGIGQREYLVIQPLAPEAAEPLISRAADAVRVLDDLGLVVKLV
jgi:hypothetical protein